MKALLFAIVFLAGAQCATFSNDGPFGNMSDLDWELLQSTGYIRATSFELAQVPVSFSAAEVSNALQQNVDWHRRFASGTRTVTRVKNQGTCGSCYIFSVLVVLETLYANKTGTLLSLSEQSVLDCVAGNGISGCQGGNPALLAAAIQSFKVPLEKDYPYSWSTFSKATVGACGATAGLVSPTVVYSIQFGTLKREDVMAAYVLRYGPLQVSIDTRSSIFKTYKAGIIDVPSGPVKLTHGVTIVGYGVDAGIPYWKIKNSWGPQWGENGYFRLYRGLGLYGVDLDPVGLGL